MVPLDSPGIPRPPLHPQCRPALLSQSTHPRPVHHIRVQIPEHRQCVSVRVPSQGTHSNLILRIGSRSFTGITP